MHKSISPWYLKHKQIEGSIPQDTLAGEELIKSTAKGYINVLPKKKKKSTKAVAKQPVRRRRLEPNLASCLASRQLGLFGVFGGFPLI